MQDEAAKGDGERRPKDYASTPAGYVIASMAAGFVAAIEVWSKYVDAILAFAYCSLIAAVLGLVPFLLILWAAHRRHAHGFVFYVLAGALAPSAAVFLIQLMTSAFPAASFRLAVFISAFFILPGAAAGLAYWLYAKRHPPISTWAAEARQAEGF